MPMINKAFVEGVVKSVSGITRGETKAVEISVSTVRMIGPGKRPTFIRVRFFEKDGKYPSNAQAVRPGQTIWVEGEVESSEHPGEAIVNGRELAWGKTETENQEGLPF